MIRFVGLEMAGVRDKAMERIRKAQAYVDEQVLLQSEPYMPRDTGALIASGRARDGVVTYSVPYARYVYYGEAMEGRPPKRPSGRALRYQGAPMRGRLWLSRMKADRGGMILAGAQEILRRG